MRIHSPVFSTLDVEQLRGKTSYACYKPKQNFVSTHAERQTVHSEGYATHSARYYRLALDSYDSTLTNDTDILS